jgi:hypothetical protein
MGQYTIVNDATVFRGNAGTYYIESLDMLKVRLSEVPTIAQLETISETEVFATALASRGTSGAAMPRIWFRQPLDTVTGLSSGVGDLFSRVRMGAGEIYSSATNSPGSGAAASETGNVTLTALGYDQVRRTLRESCTSIHTPPILF